MIQFVIQLIFFYIFFLRKKILCGLKSSQEYLYSYYDNCVYADDDDDDVADANDDDYEPLGILKNDSLNIFKYYIIANI